MAFDIYTVARFQSRCLGYNKLDTKYLTLKMKYFANLNTSIILLKEIKC